MTLTLCVVCGEPGEYRCPLHRRQQPGKLSATERGYTSAWFRLSRRARKLQPWCSACGSKEDLTGDHLRWPAKTLADCDVLCRTCNSRKGAPDDTGPAGATLEATHKVPRGMANFLTVPGGVF